MGYLVLSTSMALIITYMRITHKFVSLAQTSMFHIHKSTLLGPVVGCLRISNLTHVKPHSWSPSHKFDFLYYSPWYSHGLICTNLKCWGHLLLLHVVQSLSRAWLQHVRLPCPIFSHWVCSNSCRFSLWCYYHSSSAAPFSFCLHFPPASGSFSSSRLFASDGQIIGASASVLPVNIQGWFPLGLTALISLQSQESSPALQFEGINSLPLSLLYGATLTSIYDSWKNHTFDLWTFVAKWCLCFLICCLGLS